MNQATRDPKPSVSLVIPVLNEEANLRELLRRTVEVCRHLHRPWEIVLVDDGSEDRSASLIEDAAREYPGRILGVLLNRNYGQHAAVMAGFEASRGEIVVTLDADLQNPPEEIPKLLEKADEGCDVVGSVRILRHDSLFRRFASRLINKAVQRTTGIAMRDYGCMLRAYRRIIVEAMLSCPERSTFIPILANTFARRTAEVEVRHAPRRGGDSKYGLSRLVTLLFDLLTSMTTFPLRLLSIIGGGMAALGMGFGCFLLVMRWIYGPDWAVGGVFTLFALLFVFVGAQFMGMGLLGEYLGRIYLDVRGRPRYFVERRVGRSDLEPDAGMKAVGADGGEE